MSMQTSSRQAMDHDIIKRIVALGCDIRPETFPPLDEEINQEGIERRKAESAFQRALSRRTWWRLSPEERKTIRGLVLKDNPCCRNHSGDFLEMYCYAFLENTLKESHQRVIS